MNTVTPLHPSPDGQDNSDQPLQAQQQVLQQQLQNLRKCYQKQPMPDLATRRTWLKQLKALLMDNQEVLIQALDLDFKGRSSDETLLAEIMPSVQGINYSMRRLRRWMRPKIRFAGLVFLPATAKVIYQPLGVIGIVVPWNYPLFLAVSPLISVLAAGNRALVKMPEHTPATSALFADLVKRYLGDDLVRVVNGGPDVAAEFTRLPYDHLLFTGSTQIGHHVMRAAAENLTPVTLELGGKSPVIIDHDVNLNMAAERICYGKSMNAGQTCVAPDYVLVPHNRLDAFAKAYQQCFQRMYPDASNNQDYSSIINERQAQRLSQWLQQAREKGSKIIDLVQDTTTNHPHRLYPSLIINPDENLEMMRQEIFGPLLPIIPYQQLQDAVEFVTQRPRPLALYYFGHNRQRQRQVLENTHSGGVCINETLLHVAADDLPFGGIGPSGMGHYHAREGFLNFSKAKAIFAKGRLNSAKLIYPPYDNWLIKHVYRLFIR